jgi:hypothetical protein
MLSTTLGAGRQAFLTLDNHQWYQQPGHFFSNTRAMDSTGWPMSR